MNKKLATDTWFYAKRCLLVLIETLAKHMLVMRDATTNEILNFLVDESLDISFAVSILFLELGDQHAFQLLSLLDFFKSSSACFRHSRKVRS